MIFVVISQRAFPNNDYNLKNLPGHGRIDIIFRCLLSALRPLNNQLGYECFVYLKGKDTSGWLHLKPDNNYLGHDEISIAAEVKKNWDDYFVTGSLDNLIKKLPSTHYLLSEHGNSINTMQLNDNSVIFLGAQRDLTKKELELINPISISLGNKPLLASQAITYFRQKIKLIV